MKNEKKYERNLVHKGKAAPLKHFVLGPLWKLPRLWYCTCEPQRLLPLYYTRPYAMCVCGLGEYCISVIIRGLWRRGNRRPVIQLHTEERVRLPSCGKTGSQMDHTRNHTEKRSIVQTHICCAECMCQSGAKDRAKVLNDRGCWHWCLGCWTWTNIQIFCKPLGSHTQIRFLQSHFDLKKYRVSEGALTK